MKKLLQKIGLYLLGMKYAYTSSSTDGEVIITTTFELSEQVRARIAEELKVEKVKFRINETMMQMLKEHRGTVEDGRCFLASDQFVLGVNKEGKVKAIVDCNTPAKSN